MTQPAGGNNWASLWDDLGLPPETDKAAKKAPEVPPPAPAKPAPKAPVPSPRETEEQPAPRGRRRRGGGEPKAADEAPVAEAPAEAAETTSPTSEEGPA